MKQYLDLAEYILENGKDRDDRTGVGVRSIFGYQMRFNLANGFPLLTTKKLHLKSIVYELLWFLRGDTNIKYLNDNGVTIWDEWANEYGELGPIYGSQWRSWKCCDGRVVDQIANVIEQIKNNPTSRRLIVNSWNVGDIDKMALPPCHVMFQFYVSDGKLSCQLYQRSADVFLGVPFNIASYSILIHMIAHVCELQVGDFIHTFGDIHIYKNHFQQMKKQLLRTPKKLPQLQITRNVTDISSFNYDDIKISDYNPYPTIKGDIAV